MDPGGLRKNSKKVDERGCMRRFMTERGHRLCSIFGYNLRRRASTILFLLQMERLLLTTCNDTSKDPFSQCQQLQGIHVQLTSEYVGTLTTIELMTRKQRQTQQHE